ncbi:MAG TPA: membrane protein insertase YidC [Tepidisphaeraceae bacterium]|jgi:YidC/Oxa1 family membrane protein insertase
MANAPMETKRLILTMSLALVIIFGWQFAMFKIYGPSQRNADNAATTQPVAQVTTTAPATQFAATQGAAAQGVTTAPNATAPTMSAAAFSPVAPTTAPSVVSIGQDPKFITQLNVTTRGGAIDSVILKSFKNSEGKGQYQFQGPYDRDNAATYSMALRTVIINGTPVDVSGAVWRVTEQRDDAVALALELSAAGADKPVLRIVRNYSVVPATSPSKGYDQNFSQTVQNLTPQPMTVKLVYNGPTTPPREIERGLDLQVLGGYNDDNYVSAVAHPVESFDAKTTTMDMTTSGKLPLLWVGVESIYFESIVRPLPLDEKNPSPKHIQKVTAEAVNPAAEPHERQVRLMFETEPVSLAPNALVDHRANIFFGPKQRSLLNDTYYASFPRMYNEALVVASGACAWCTSTKLINVLVGVLGFFHIIFRDWGLSIIALVLLVRALLHPITKRSQISMMKMGKMGPEVERLKKKHGDNKDELNKAMMQLYKEQGFTPVLGCLPMFLQMPIWIALWSALQSTFELRQAPFLYGMTWIHDLAKPDQLIKFSQPIPLLVFGWHLYAINLLPLLMIVVTWMNQKYMPQPPATTPEAEQQQKMMKWMTLVFPLMFYSMPSGLNLYYVTSMGLGIIESKIIRDHIKQREEEEKEGRVIVDAPRSMKKRRDDEGGSGAVRRKPVPDAPKSGLGKWLADIQSKAEDLRKQAEKGKK